MLPFRVFDREKKVTWIVLNFQPDATGGTYLVAREDDSNQDGEISCLSIAEIRRLRLVGLYNESGE